MTDYIIPDLREHAVPVGDLRLDPANANTHPEKNLNAIKDSLAAFGQRQVVLARKDNSTVIAGNGRLLAARALGWSHIACVFVDDDDMTAVRYAIADNRTSELSEWDNDVLSMLLSTIRDDLGSLEGTGFESGDLDSLLGALDVPGEDDWGTALENLPEGERTTGSTKNFTLSAHQVEIVDRAVKLALANGVEDCPDNPNKNGNALAHICQEFLDTNG